MSIDIAGIDSFQGERSVPNSQRFDGIINESYLERNCYFISSPKGDRLIWSKLSLEEVTQRELNKSVNSVVTQIKSYGRFISLYR